MATSMMQNKKTAGSWQTVKSKSEDKKKRVDEKKKQDVQKDRLGVTVAPEKNVFAAIDSAWKQQTEQASLNVLESTPYAGAFTGLTVEQVTLDEPESPATPPNSDRQAAEIAQRKQAEAKVKKPKKVKPSTSQVAQGVDVSALQASFREWEDKYQGSEVSQLEMLADFFLKTFKECELQFNNIVVEKSLQKSTEVPLSEVPVDLISAVEAFVAAKQDESLKFLILMLLAATFEGVPEGVRSRTGIPPPKAKVGLLILLALVIRSRPQALLAASPDMLLAGRTLTAPGRIPQLLWVLNQAASVNASASVAVWTRLILPQLLGSNAFSKKNEASDAKIICMDSPAHSPVLDYLEQLLSRPIDADVTLSSATLPTVPGSVVEAISHSCFSEVYTGSAPASTRSRLQALFTPLQTLASNSTSLSHFLEWLPLALDTAASGSGGCDGSGDESVARATTSAVACLSKNPACCSVYLQKHKGLIKGSARVLGRLANSPASVLRPITSDPEALTAFSKLLTQLPARHKFYLHQGKGWQGSAARSAEASIQQLQRRLNKASPSASSLSPVFTSLFLLTVTTSGLLYAAHNRHAVASKAAEYLSEEYSAILLQALEAVNSTAGSVVDSILPHLQPMIDVARPQMEMVRETVRPHVESTWELLGSNWAALSEGVGVEVVWDQVSEWVQVARDSDLAEKFGSYVDAASAKVQQLLASVSSQ